MKLYLLNPFYIALRKQQILARRAVPILQPLREWQQAVIDRSQDDVEYVKLLAEKGWKNLTVEERSDWLAGLKGTLNRSDLLRIENNLQLLADVLELPLQTYADAVPDVPNEEYFKNLSQNVKTIREAYCIHSDTPPLPSLPFRTYDKINDIEKILNDVYQILIDNFHYYCGGEIYAGDSIGALL